MPRIKLGPWRPDAPVFDNPGLLDVRNAIQANGLWLPQPGLAIITSQTLAGPILGLFNSNRSTGGQELFISYGGKIYLVSGVSAPLTDLSTGTYSTNEFTRWRPAQFGDLLVVTNFEDEIQAYDLFAGGSFAPLGDASDEVPRAKYVAVVKGILTVAYTFDDVDGEDGYQVRWSGIVNGIPQANEWPRDVGTQADSQRLSEIGIISGITGGEFGTVIGENGVVRQSLGEALFRFDTVERRIGSRTPNSVVQYRQLTFFWSPQGWAAFDGNSVRLIGVEKVDRWFDADFDEQFAHKMWATVEEGRGHILWAYCGKGHSGEPNRMLRYSVELDEWAISDFELQALGLGRTFGRTLDDSFFANLDDSIHDNLDDPALWASQPLTVAVSGNRLRAFTGAPRTGVFETGEFDFSGESKRSMLRKATVRGRGGVIEMSIFARERSDEGGIWSDRLSQQSDGAIRFRVPGRTHRMRITRSSSWVDLVDVDLGGETLGEL